MAQSMAAVFPSAASQEMADNLVIRKIPSAMRQTVIMFVQAPSTLRQAKMFICQNLSLFPFSSLFSFWALLVHVLVFYIGCFSRSVYKGPAFSLGDSSPWHRTAFLGSFLGARPATRFFVLMCKAIMRIIQYITQSNNDMIFNLCLYL